MHADQEDEPTHLVRGAHLHFPLLLSSLWTPDPRWIPETTDCHWNPKCQETHEARRQKTGTRFACADLMQIPAMLVNSHHSRPNDQAVQKHPPHRNASNEPCCHFHLIPTGNTLAMSVRSSKEQGTRCSADSLSTLRARCQELSARALSVASERLAAARNACLEHFDQGPRRHFPPGPTYK